MDIREKADLEVMQIFIRSDLRVRKGKIASQSAHAACAQLLNAMDDHGSYRILRAADYAKLRNLIDNDSVEIRMVPSEEALRTSVEDPSRFALIIDRGLTEFGGVHTPTTAASGVFEHSPIKAEPMSGADLIARQWFVFSKQHVLPKEHAAKLAAIGCLAMMASMLTPEPNGDMKLSLDNPAVHGWLTAGFGKIGMGIKTDEGLDALRAKLEADGVHCVETRGGQTKLLVFGPEFPSRMAALTGKESEVYQNGSLTLL